MAVNGNLLNMKTKKPINEENSHYAADQNILMKYLCGWLDQSKKRHGICLWLSHGKAKIADTDAMKEQILQIVQIMSTHKYMDLWNTDRFEFLLPSTTFSNIIHFFCICV